MVCMIVNDFNRNSQSGSVVKEWYRTEDNEINYNGIFFVQLLDVI